MRNAVFANCNFNLHAGIVHLTEHFLDPANRLSVKAWRFGQFNNDHLPGQGFASGCLGNQDILSIAAVFGCHQPNTALVQQTSNDRVRGSLRDLQNPTFWPTLFIQPGHPRNDNVLVQNCAHFVGREINIGLSIITHDKTVPITMAFDYSLEFFKQACLSAVVFFDMILCFPECPGGGIGRRTSFRY